ncbi:MAG: tripartite tricarboxylate transporter substrate binding protein [Pseudomonadota bacterium]
MSKHIASTYPHVITKVGNCVNRSALPSMLFAAIAVFASGPAAAQSRAATDAADFPSRPIRIILPTTAGSGVDITARTIAQKLTEAWGQQVVVDNRPGANGIIGMEALAKSKADGYTLLQGFTSVLTINPYVYKSLPYDTFRDHAPITQTVTNTMVLVVNPFLPVRSAKELVALGRSRPGDLVYASAGIGNLTHLAGELLRVETKIKALHVPYKGETPAFTAVAGGETAFMFIAALGVSPHIASGKLRLLATCGEKRATAFPNAPTMIESGFPKVVVTGWGGFLAPVGTAPEILQKVQRETARVLFAPDIRERLSSLGAEPVGSNPEQFAAFVKAEAEKWSRVTREAGIYHSQ